MGHREPLVPRLPCLSFWGIPSDFWLLVNRPRMHPRASRAPGPFVGPFLLLWQEWTTSWCTSWLEASMSTRTLLVFATRSVQLSARRFLVRGGGQAPKAATAIVCLYTARHCHSPGHYCKEKRPKHRPFAGPSVFGFLWFHPKVGRFHGVNVSRFWSWEQTEAQRASKLRPYSRCAGNLGGFLALPNRVSLAGNKKQFTYFGGWCPVAKLCCGTRAASGMLELSWAAFVSSTPNLCIFTSLGPLFQGSEHKHHRNTQALEVRRVICS